MADQQGARPGWVRYWPVGVVAAIVAGALALSASGGDDDPTSSPSSSGSPASAGDGAPALAAFEGEDPLGAPDCDAETGRLQIPMVYAPDCVPLWPEDGDNGGATYQGVTEDEIKVAVYVAQENAEVSAATEGAIGRELPTAAETDRDRQRVFDALNGLWETYGRTVTYELLPASGAATDDAAAKADAIRAAEEMDVFAVLGGPVGTKAFAEELAAREVVCFCAEGYPAEKYDEWDPYIWSAGMSTTFRNTFVADLVEALAGQPAEHAGEALASTERKFAYVYADTPDSAYESASDELLEDLAARGVEMERYSYGADLAGIQEQAGTFVARMEESGVTSVVYSGEPFMGYFLTLEATSQDWFPEWILTGSAFTDLAVVGRSYDQRQWAHAFGISTLVARVSPEVTESEGSFIDWFDGEDLTSLPAELFTAPILLTGIQLAGPELTPTTFRDGLFSYTAVGGGTTNIGLSFGTSTWGRPDFTGADDVTLVWWDPEAVGPHEVQTDGETGTGMYRYVDGGRRYGPGELAGATWTPFFDEAGSVLLYDERPAQDRAPSYEPRQSRTG